MISKYWLHSLAKATRVPILSPSKGKTSKKEEVLSRDLPKEDILQDSKMSICLLLEEAIKGLNPLRLEDQTIKILSEGGLSQLEPSQLMLLIGGCRLTLDFEVKKIRIQLFSQAEFQQVELKSLTFSPRILELGAVHWVDEQGYEKTEAQLTMFALEELCRAYHTHKVSTLGSYPEKMKEKILENRL